MCHDGLYTTVVVGACNVKSFVARDESDQAALGYRDWHMVLLLFGSIISPICFLVSDNEDNLLTPESES